MQRLRVAGGVAALGACALAAFVFSRDSGQENRAPSDVTSPEHVAEAHDEYHDSGLLKQAVAIEEPMGTALKGNLLDSIPWGRRPMLDEEDTSAARGGPAEWQHVQPVAEFSIRTGGYKDLAEALKGARFRVRPRSLKNLYSNDHPRFGEIRIIYDDFIGRLQGISDDWAEADLHYRDTVVQEQLYHRWKDNEPQPDVITANPSRSIVFTEGWTVAFTYEQGVSSQYDAVRQLRDDLISEMYQEIELLLES